jgi:hypothetical protein
MMSMAVLQDEWRTEQERAKEAAEAALAAHEDQA